MKTKTIFLLIIYTIIFTTLVTIATLPDELKTIDRTIEFSTIVSANKAEIFNLMADVEKYPLILPDTFVAVEILDKTNDSIRALETARELEIEKTFQLQHNFIPFESHEIMILDGDAEGSKIIIWFTEINENSTQISVKLNLHLKGLLVPFAVLPDSNIEHAFHTILEEFIQYLENDYDVILE